MQTQLRGQLFYFSERKFARRKFKPRLSFFTTFQYSPSPRGNAFPHLYSYYLRYQYIRPCTLLTRPATLPTHWFGSSLRRFATVSFRVKHRLHENQFRKREE